MKCGVYRITNIITGKVYIGSSERIEDRWKRHQSELRCNTHHSKHLQRSFNKYGELNFVYDILEECASEIILEREQYYKDFYQSYKRDYGYDMCQFAGNCKGRKQSKESIEKIKISISLYWDLVGRPNKDRKSFKKQEFLLLNNKRKQRNLEIIDLLIQGVRQDEISSKYNISPSIVTKIKKENNLIINSDVRKGSNNNFSKLNENQVREIKILLNEKVKHQEIADKFKVSKRTIKAIKSGQNWSHITI